MRPAAITIKNRQKNIAVDPAKIRSALRIARAHACNAYTGSIAVCFVDDKTITLINKAFHNSDRPTDVLAFSFMPGRSTPAHADIAVSAETALRSARRYRVTPRKELLLYVIHGFLHIAGYDDRTQAKRAHMRKTERAILAECKRQGIF